MKVLIACERSGIVRNAFLDRGHDAWSCDLNDTEQPGPHITGDVLDVLDEGWDLMIAHPECTYLTCSAEWAYGPGPYHQKVKPETLTGEARQKARREAIRFAIRLWEAPIDRIAIENPVGVLSRHLGRPQVIQPHWFGHDASKATCLWLKNLPRLVTTKYIDPRIVVDDKGIERKRWANQCASGCDRTSPGPDRWISRSRTYYGVADAMSQQWG